MVPNTLTSLNLFSGCVACVVAFEGEYLLAACFVLIASVFDFFDGFTARMLHAPSPIGKELDSLADMVSFGVAPGVFLYNFLVDAEGLPFSYLAFIAFLIPVFSALRLAKFNLDKRQTSSFIGLPTPANAVFWIFLIVALDEMWLTSLSVVIILIVLELLFCYLMISELPMFSLKFKTFGFKANRLRYSFLLASLALIFLLQWKAFPAIIALYLVLSVANDILSRNKDVA